MTPYYERDGIVIYHGDCREIASELPQVDLVVTSPPYADQRRYGFTKGEFRWDHVVPRALAAVNLTPDGQMLVNLGLVHRDGEVVCYWDQMIATLRAFEYRLFGWYSWDQGDGLTGAWGGHFAPSHEWIFHFNRQAKEPNKFVPCKHAGVRRQTGTIRAVTGAMIPKSGIGQAVAPFKVPDSVIRINRRSLYDNNGHPAQFPLPLATFLLKAYDGIVIDPFMGAGTTLVSAYRLGRQAIGIEIEERYCEIAAERLSQGVLPMEMGA